MKNTGNCLNEMLAIQEDGAHDLQLVAVEVDEEKRGGGWGWSPWTGREEIHVRIVYDRIQYDINL